MRYSQQKYKEQYEKRKAEHKCVICGCDLDNEQKGFKCEMCSKIYSYNQKKYRKRKAENHQCRRCGKTLPTNAQFKTCLVCRLKEREYKSKLKNE